MNLIPDFDEFPQLAFVRQQTSSLGSDELRPPIQTADLHEVINLALQYHGEDIVRFTFYVRSDTVRPSRHLVATCVKHWIDPTFNDTEALLVATIASLLYLLSFHPGRFARVEGDTSNFGGLSDVIATPATIAVHTDSVALTPNNLTEELIFEELRETLPAKLEKFVNMLIQYPHRSRPTT